MKKTIITDVIISDTLKSLNKMIDNLTIKKKYNEEAVVKIIFNHLGFTIAYIDGEKELNKITSEIKKDLKILQKEKKEEIKEEKAFEKAMSKAKTKKAPKKTSSKK